MKIILTVDSLDFSYGGPSRSVPALAQALSDLGISLELWTLQEREVERLKVRSFRSSVDVARALQRIKSDDLILHDNGLWRPFNGIVCRTAKRCRIPYVVSTRGMLQPWSLRQSRFKKLVAWYAYQKRLLKGSALLHATGAMEAASIRGLGLRNPILIQPNGIDLPPTRVLRRATDRAVLFLSRLHEVKGLEMLFEAWAALCPSGWTLRIAGTGSRSYVNSLKLRAVQLGIHGQLEWLGELDDEQKRIAFESATLFVLPSFSENFGIVVAESLAAGVPVITTTATPWVDLEKHGCGKCVPADSESIQNALQDLLQLSHEERVAMGAKGRRWMENEFAWPSIATRMLEAYEAMLTGKELRSYL